MEFKVIKLDRKRNNVVLSRRAVVEASMGEERAKLLETLSEGAIVNGVVKNITEYGAFVDLGGIDGLLHITDMAWRRVRHPSEVVQVGQELHRQGAEVRRREEPRLAGHQAAGRRPVDRREPAATRTGTRLFGKVTNIADYGAFVEIEPGIEGLVHVSEMDWTNKNVAPAKVVTLGDEVEVMVLEIDEDKRRISLGMKQCKANPWEEFAENRASAATRSRARSSRSPTSACSWAWPQGIDGLVHLSDLSWDETGRNRRSQLQEGPGSRSRRAGCGRRARAHLAGHQAAGQRPVHQPTPRSMIVALTVTGKVITVDPRGAEIELAEGVTGLSARFGNLPRPRGRCPQRGQGRRRSHCRHRQHRPQDAQRSSCPSRPRTTPTTRKP